MNENPESLENEESEDLADSEETTEEDLRDVELASLVPPKPEASGGTVACDQGHTVAIALHESHSDALARHYHNGHT